MLGSLASIRINYAHYHGESRDKLIEMIETAESTLTELLITFGMAEKEFENEVERTTRSPERD